MKSRKILVVVVTFLSHAVLSSTGSVGQVYGLGINEGKVKSNWLDGKRILYTLDSNRTLNGSTARGVLGLRTGSTEFSAYFRGYQICSIIAFDDVAASVTLGSKSYAECVNEYPAVKANRTAEPVSTYSFFKGCFRKIYNIRTNQYKSPSDERNCSCLFQTDMKEYVLQRVNVTLKEEIRVRKCAEKVIEEFQSALYTTVQNYKTCTGEIFSTTISSSLGTSEKPTNKTTEKSTVKQTTDGTTATTNPSTELSWIPSTESGTTTTAKYETSSIPPYFSIIEAAVSRFQESFGASIDRVREIVGTSVESVKGSLSQVKSINISQYIASLESIAKRTVALISSAGSNRMNTANCTLLEADLGNYLKQASSSVNDCILNATNHLNSWLETASAVEARVTAALDTNGTAAIRRCAISLYSMSDEAVRVCTEDALRNFSIYIEKDSITDIDVAVSTANSAQGATKQAKKCLEVNYTDFTRQAYVVYQTCVQVVR